MTGVAGLGSWVDRSWWVGGGQDVLGLMRYCTREKSFHVSRCMLGWRRGDTNAGGHARHRGGHSPRRKSSLTTWL